MIYSEVHKMHTSDIGTTQLTKFIDDTQNYECNFLIAYRVRRKIGVLSQPPRVRSRLSM